MTGNSIQQPSNLRCTAATRTSVGIGSLVHDFNLRRLGPLLAVMMLLFILSLPAARAQGVETYTFTSASIPVGSHTVKAEYAGDGNFAGVTASLS